MSTNRPLATCRVVFCHVLVACRQAGSGNWSSQQCQENCINVRVSFWWDSHHLLFGSNWGSITNLLEHLSKIVWCIHVGVCWVGTLVGSCEQNCVPSCHRERQQVLQLEAHEQLGCSSVTFDIAGCAFILQFCSSICHIFTKARA